MKTNLVFGQPYGSDEGGWRRSSYAAARNGSGRTDPTPAARPWVATQGRALLSEQVELNGFGYYKGGKAQAHSAGSSAAESAECAALFRPTASGDPPVLEQHRLFAMDFAQQAAGAGLVEGGAQLWKLGLFLFLGVPLHELVQ